MTVPGGVPSPCTVESDSGYTLIELAVVAGLMSLVAILVFTTLIGGLRTAARGEKRTDDVNAAQVSMLQMTADLRASYDVVSATSDKVVVLTRSRGASDSSPTDAASERVTYERTATGLLTMVREQGTLPDGGVWTPNSATAPAPTTLARGVLSSVQAGRPLFSMLSKADSQKQCENGSTASTLAAPLSTADLDRVYSFDLWLSVNSSPNVSPRPVTVPGGAVIANDGELKLDVTNVASAGIGTGCY